MHFMSYFVNPVEEDKCVFLIHEGEMSALELSAARYEANGVVNHRNWNRLVVDITQLQSVPAPLELYAFAKGLASSVSHATRVALVIRPDQERHARIFEKATRKGRLFLTYFLGPEKALAWVKQPRLVRQKLARCWNAPANRAQPLWRGDKDEYAGSVNHSLQLA